MTARIKPSDDRKKPVGQVEQDVDRKVLRTEVNERYEHTLRHLGK